MANTVIIGAQWGDEGKGKIVDLLSGKSQLVVRFQGGANAGHTLKVNGRETILHLVPSGILNTEAVNVIGNGVVFDPQVFLAEIDSLRQNGVDVSPKRLAVSQKAHVIMPYHKLLDKGREESRADGKIGTTGRGIGPCYEDKVARIGIRVGDFLNPELLKQKINYALKEKNALFTTLYKMEPLDAATIYDELMKMAPAIIPYVSDTDAIIHEAINKDKNILFEGAQGIHLDIDHGTYPFVTSSNTVSGSASCGTGIAPRDIDEVIGVVKAYTTRVGAGPFPTELEDETGSFLREKGHEFGATTGRPRRCGWLDAVILRESMRLNGLSGIALTKLDVLQNLSELKICTAYELDGKKLAYPPQNEGDLARVRPVYETLPGYAEDISSIRNFESLPDNARNYIRRIEELLGCPVTFVSTGPGREQTIIRQADA